MSSQNNESLPDSAVFHYRYNRLANLNKYNRVDSCLDQYEKPRSSFDNLQSKGNLIEHIHPASQAYMNSWR